VSKQPIIFDFTKGQAYRASTERNTLSHAMQAAASKAATGRVVRKAAEGIPPQVVTQPKP
jgi:hypothetical protein